MAGAPSNEAPYRLLRDVDLGAGVALGPFTNLYGCRIGDLTRIGPFVEIQAGVRVGERCKIQSHTFICTGVTIEDEVFVGHGVLFVNDKRPRATTAEGALQGTDDWDLLETVVEERASLGSGAVVLGGVRIGAGALVGAGAVVTRDVAPAEVVAGSPARPCTGRALTRRPAGRGLTGGARVPRRPVGSAPRTLARTFCHRAARIRGRRPARWCTAVPRRPAGEAAQTAQRGRFGPE